MRFFTLVTGMCLLLLTGCIKNEKGCSNVSPASEEAQITAYAAANNMVVTKHSTGLYYQVVNPGTGAAPTVNNTVTVTYTGKFLTGGTFDQASTPVQFRLGQVIDGWIVGLGLIAKGGKIKLIVPSAMAYGCVGAGTIPGNTVLFFEVDLLNIQ